MEDFFDFRRNRPACTLAAVKQKNDFAKKNEEQVLYYRCYFMPIHTFSPGSNEADFKIHWLFVNIFSVQFDFGTTPSAYWSRQIHFRQWNIPPDRVRSIFHGPLRREHLRLWNLPRGSERPAGSP